MPIGDLWADVSTAVLYVAFGASALQLVVTVVLLLVLIIYRFR